MDEALDRIIKNENNQFDKGLAREFVAFIKSTATFVEIKAEPSAKDEKKTVKNVLEEMSEKV